VAAKNVVMLRIPTIVISDSDHRDHEQVS